MNSLIRRRVNPVARNISKRELLTPFDELFNSMMGDMFPSMHREYGENFFVQGSYPKVNVINNESDVTIEAAIPGLDKENVDVEVDNGVLTIRAESNQHSDIADSQYVKREIKRSAFQRSFRLGENLDEANITGVYDKGVLTLVVPKVVPTEEHTQARKIEIK